MDKQHKLTGRVFGKYNIERDEFTDKIKRAFGYKKCKLCGNNHRVEKSGINQKYKR